MTIMIDRDRLFSSMAENRAREVVAHIGFLRNLRQLYEGGVTQTRLAEVNGVSQPAISQMLQRARIEAPDVRPGTHGGTAYEVAARCAAGEIDPETMRAELIGWEYDKPLASTGYPDVDDVRPHTEGGFNHQVGRALAHGFLTDEDYDLILDALAD
ncbi:MULTISPECIES: hypothetical protein [unclassified Rhodococcus (in: high G+C Gram-positive bacteria)]|jgi:DNA-binding transcriptional regulator YdaS (Cro superfamily)|uniref:hypothetical protein n=1 Tax=unclassified Rhodococcus (in: high G+C Gram-positive bacteria) TaxID=192944 RepID=UPI001320150A|nr:MULTISPECIES: hypothetical protein [unclassified Rhodococcus (in: high G+C Gram-positive bacteria)]QHE68601.1 hypothetical protein GFS60_02135 [Rhodococcus sp. WAY2]